MSKWIGLSGSLRKNSFNTAILNAAAGMVPDGVVLSVLTLHGIPPYDGDLEESTGIPEAVTRLKDAVAGAESLLIATPEYNNSIPGVLKNAIDWMTRPAADIPKVFGGKPIALLGASMGGFGTVLAQNEWLPILRFLGTRPWFGGRLLISGAHKLFDARGQLTDEKTRDNCREFLRGFAHFVDQARR